MVDMLKIKMTLEQEKKAFPSCTSLSQTFPNSKDDFYRQGKQQVEHDLLKAKSALKESQERVECLDAEKDEVLRQLHSSEEACLMVLTELEEVCQRLRGSDHLQAKL
ncbi:centrosome-associated protein CEP250-like isoform X1 [Arapaima gigas]